MKKFTFNLMKNNTSDDLYFDLSYLTNKIRKHMKREFSSELEDFAEFHKISSYEGKRYENEYIVDILLIGVVWKEFIDKSLNISKYCYKLMEKYTYDAKELGKLKTEFKNNIIKNKFYKNYYGRNKDDKVALTNFNNFDTLVKYLACIKDYKEYYDRLCIWRDFLSNLRGEYCQRFLSKIISTYDSYYCKIDEKLYGYISGYDEYLAKIKLARYSQIDLFNIYVPKSLVYLNLIGSQLVNEVNLSLLEEVQEKFCIMSSAYLTKGKKCTTPLTARGRLCDECSFDCRMSKIARIFKLYKYQVYITDVDFLKFENLNLEENVAIISFSDVSNLLKKYYNYRKSDSLVVILPYDIDDLTNGDLEINMNYIINNVIN